MQGLGATNQGLLIRKRGSVLSRMTDSPRGRCGFLFQIKATRQISARMVTSWRYVDTERLGNIFFHFKQPLTPAHAYSYLAHRSESPADITNIVYSKIESHYNLDGPKGLGKALFKHDRQASAALIDAMPSLVLLPDASLR
jgi:hypothetical protein